MPHAKRVCPTPGCPELTESGRCSRCKTEAEARRGTAARRGYDHKHRTRFRQGVLRRDPLCVCIDQHRGHGTAGCLAPSVHADHHPRGRDELERLDLDPNDPQYGRGLCGPCHSWHTTQAQPGGWNAR
jgi:5-methylcytosine-specific restriction protein A